MEKTWKVSEKLLILGGYLAVGIVGFMVSQLWNYSKEKQTKSKTQTYAQISSEEKPKQLSDNQEDEELLRYFLSLWK